MRMTSHHIFLFGSKVEFPWNPMIRWSGNRSRLLLFLAVFQLGWFIHIHRLVQLTQSDLFTPPLPMTTTNRIQASSSGDDEYTLWSKTETYFEHCRDHCINNKTWGEPLGPLVDKIESKEILKAMKIDGLEIPRTLAVFDTQNFTRFDYEAMHSIPQPYIIKPAHTSGGVARVKNDTYQCFKHCEVVRPVHLSKKEAVETNQAQLEMDLTNAYSEKHNELQYQGIPHRIIVEEDVMVGNITKDVTYWYTAGGKPLFVSMQCGDSEEGAPGTTAGRVFFTIDFKRLAVKLTKSACEKDLPKPSNWERQVEIVTKLAQNIQRSVRIDLYAGGDDIFFSEFTFTTGFCAPKLGFKPRIADGLLYAVDKGRINSSDATPDYIQHVVNDKAWNLVAMEDAFHLLPNQTKSYPSPVDLCESLSRDTIRYSAKKWQTHPKVQTCLRAAREVAANPFRCLLVRADGTADLKAIGGQKEPTFASVMERVDYGLAFSIFLVVSYMTYYDIGTKHQPNQYMNNVYYLGIMLVILYFTLPEVHGVFSGIPIHTIANEAFNAFKLVHPMESPIIAISHFLTYWFKIASWRSKSLRNLLFFQLCVETISCFCNEWAHHTEEQSGVRCMRLAFIGAVKHYAFDSLIRTYICPPFFVYGWLLPNFLWHWGCKGLAWTASTLLG